MARKRGWLPGHLHFQGSFQKEDNYVDAVPEYSTQFHRDVKLAQKRGKDMAKLRDLLAILIADQPLSPRYKDHPLRNNWSGYRDAHIEPDWILIYCTMDDVVRFERTGTHSDLFE